MHVILSVTVSLRQEGLLPPRGNTSFTKTKKEAVLGGSENSGWCRGSGGGGGGGGEPAGREKASLQA